ncbi:hypothetical protein TNCV_4400351 [Trichonephila clavipes]|nr:hypothetical protein TNCV_4400351 [Trichonephila clavipes]
MFRYLRAVGSLVVRASDSRLEGLGSMPDATKHPPSTHGFTCRNCGGGDRGRVAIYRPFGEFRRAKSYCHLYGAEGQRQAVPLVHATMNFVGYYLDLTTSDQVALENNNNKVFHGHLFFSLLVNCTESLMS